MKKNKLKIGVLTDNNIIPAWFYELLSEIRHSQHSELTLIIYHNTRQQQSKRLNQQFRHLADNFILNIYKRFEHIAFRPKPNAFEPKKICSLVGNKAPAVDLHYNSSGLNQAGDEIEKIKSYQIDVLLQTSPKKVSRALANCARYGVWTFYRAENGQKLDDTAGINEVFEARCTTYVRLWKLSGKPENDKLIHTSSFCTNENSINWNRHFFFWKARTILPRKLEELHRLGPEKFFARANEKTSHSGLSQSKHGNPPGNLKMLMRVAALFLRYAKRKTNSIFYFKQWILLFDTAKPAPNNIRPEHFIRKVPGKDRLWADPFIIKRKNSYFVFCEEMLYNEQKGRIVVMEIDKDGICHKPLIALERNYHISYPFLIEDKGELYMLPETSRNRRIELYKCTDFPLGWVYVETLLNNVEAADSTLFKHDGMYWLFTAIRENESTSINDNLYLFFSNSLRNGKWIPHPLNPIVSDVEGARPAGGIFKRGPRIFRPAQNASNYYGYGLKIMEIIKLSEDEYEEKLVHSIHPKWCKDVLGTHTYNFSGQMTVMDALIKRKKIGR